MASIRPTRGSIRDVALWVSAIVLWSVPPLVARADPATPPVPAPAAPLTVTRPDQSDAEARREANRAAILDARLAELRVGLQLNAAQDALWPPVADAIRGFDAARGRHFRLRLQAVANSIDGLKMQGEHMAKVGVAMGKLADATKPLVASLTPDQRSRLPTLLQRMRPRQVMARAFELPADSAPGGFGRRPMEPGGFGQRPPEQSGFGQRLMGVPPAGGPKIGAADGGSVAQPGRGGDPAFGDPAGAGPLPQADDDDD